MDIENLLSRIEGKTLEHKRDASSPAPILRTVCAFANTAGGILLIGIEDRTRRIVGVDDPLDLEERIINLCSDGIRPHVQPEVEVTSHRGKHLLVVTVFPGPLRPYYLRSKGREDGACIRIGSTNRRASSEILAELERTTKNITFDEQPLLHLPEKRVSRELAQQRFGDLRKIGSRDLEKLSLVVRADGRLVPTVGGLLLFGDQRLSEFPDARIRAARFGGIDRARIIDRAEILSDPVQAVDDALEFVQKHSNVGMRITGSRRKDVPLYPTVALREAIVNSVVHADYSQKGSPIRIALFEGRIEIENPGLLPFGLTIEDIRRGASKLRNRVLGRVFHELGLIELWGSGIQRMSRACEEAGLSVPQLEEVGTGFRVTIDATRSESRAPGDPTDEEILALLAGGRSLSTSVIAEQIGVTPRTIRTRMRRLVDRGFVVEIGQGPRDPGRVYRLGV
ncbi:MAG: helix-turn-helix domain-containing protein [Planctomycetota bacterium]